MVKWIIIIFLLRLIICFILSFLIGLEREFCGSNAGLRTTIIVCIGAFLFVSASYNSYDDDMMRIPAQVISGIGFLGAGASTSKIEDSIYEYYQDQNVSDLIVKSTRVTGFAEDEITVLEYMYGKDNIMLGTSFEMETNGEVNRYYYLDLDNININKMKLLEGKMPAEETEVLVERSTASLKEYQVGDTITYNNITYTVSGIVVNPLYFQNLEEVSYIEDKELTSIIYFNSNPYVPVNDIYVSFSDKTKFDNMSDDYQEKVDSEKDRIEKELDEVTVLSLFENISFYKLYMLTDKINIIAFILLIGFGCVAALVVLSTMTRLIEEERKRIGCLTTLGYSKLSIIFKYLIFASISTVIGGALAYFLGIFIMDLIYYNFDAVFVMPPMTNKISNDYYIITLLILVLSTLAVTFHAGSKVVKEKPALIFKKKAPVKGKKILLEKIPFIWNNLSFKYKSTCRNLFRYKKHFLMTIISVAGSTILVFLAMGLLSYSLTDELLGDALTFICIVILIFAGLLTMLVIYTLVNINISERYKEISTLMVLGYYNKEVCGYIYREIYIMSLIGVILGLPLGYLSLIGIFGILDFGSIDKVGFYVYILTPLLTLSFTVLITKILKKKITNVNINEALKEDE